MQPRSGDDLANLFVTMLNEHDPDLVDEFIAVDYRNHNRYVDDGREANRDFWRSFFAALPDLTASMDDLVVSGDRVVGRFVYRGTHRGTVFGIPATGRTLEMRSIDIWRVADGFFVEHWDEVNILDMLRQIGFVGFLKAGLTWPADQLGKLSGRAGHPATGSNRSSVTPDS